VEGAVEPQFTTLAQAVETRAQTKVKPCTKLKVPSQILDISKAEFASKQTEDSSLENCRRKARDEEVQKCKGGGQVRYIEKGKLMYREFTNDVGVKSCQLIVPKSLRETVLKVAHDTLFSGHLGVRKTTDRIVAEFYWPGVCVDVSRYCRSCDICQRTIAKGKVSKVPLGKMPLIDTPFKRVAVDIVGPIEPMTDRKNRYILTMVDYATRYPEAVALSSIETEKVAEALVDMFSRLGIPEEMLTDCGTQFTSELMSEVSRLLSLKQLTTTPYHPICNGLVEKFNGSLKQMLKRMCHERPKDWDKYLNAVLFAYREVPQESLGFSPFELLYGRTVRGPVTILKELWSGKTDDDEIKTTYQYVLDLQERLEETCRLAQENLAKSSRRYQKYYDRKARARSFKQGNKVLVLLPSKHNKLLLHWKGPFVVEEVVNKLDYRVNMNGKLKTFHANMLKEYCERERVQDAGVLSQVCAAVITETEIESKEQEVSQTEVDEVVLCPLPLGEETYQNVDINPDLTESCKQDIESLLEEFSDVFTDIPGNTTLIEHNIQLTTTDPIRVKGYPVPFHLRETVKEEVEKMLQLGVIEPSNSPFASPIVLIRKRDGTVRFCIDFRQLNKVTVFDAEPMPNIEAIFAKVSKYKYFSKLDLSKGYWQVPMSDKARALTSFDTGDGLYMFRKMPFGLVNAPATFCRLMRMVLKDLGHSDSFVDDILTFSMSWHEHVIALRELLTRLRECKLTARPTKCSIGYCKIECLGHVLGEDQTLAPVPSKIQAIIDVKRPETKKQVRSFLGVVGFYRKFVPNFAAIAVPLTDLTKKGQPNKVIWGTSQERAFCTLKKSLIESPILKLPDLEQTFILRVDASDVGLGAVLLQEHEDGKYPVAYASRKLLPRERNYSVIEKECLAVVWGVSKFHRFLFGKEFDLETDHQPLTYLNKVKMQNSRLMRWALALQPYRMRIRAIPGRENVGADYLSRAEC
jgi:hypothetical protein